MNRVSIYHKSNNVKGLYRSGKSGKQIYEAEIFYSRKYIVQGDISKSCNWSNTEICCYIGIELVYEVLRFTETANFC